MLKIKSESTDVWEKREDEPLMKPKRRGRPSKNAPLSCAMCNFETNNVQYLIEHTKIHPNKAVFHCPHCPSFFTQKGNLQAHIRTHTKERPYQCEYCTFSASQRGNLVVHKRKHTKEKPYRCSQCDYETAQVANLRSHQVRKHAIKNPSDSRLVLKLKMYSCSYCSFVCRRKAEMAQHVQSTHPDWLQPGMPTPHFLDMPGMVPKI